MIVFLSLGSNIGDRAYNLDRVYSLIQMEEKIKLLEQIIDFNIVDLQENKTIQ